jgi:hypothetical protein
MAGARTTIWIGGDDEESPVGITREDHSVMIAASWPAGDLEIIIGPGLFPLIRETMDRAETAARGN